MASLVCFRDLLAVVVSGDAERGLIRSGLATMFSGLN